LKRGWMRSRLSASALAVLLSTVLLGQDRTPLTRGNAPSERSTEWKLAGAVPGHTTFQKAKSILGKSYSDDSDYKATWSTCEKELVIESDRKGIVKVVRVVRISDTPPAIDCFGRSSGESKWVTGLGLRLDDSTERVIQLYGQPDSRRPSTKGVQQLELLYYDIDLRDPKVTHVMDVRCTPEKDGKPGRVLEITLAVRNL
jgi:hypothetical protein